MSGAINPAAVERTRLDAGDGVVSELVTVRGARSGPTISLLGRIHGDEPEGTLAIEMFLADLDAASLCGTVRAIPVANPAAARAQTRLSPVDGLNLAREFPGRPSGSSSQCLAHLITQQVISGSDLLVDLHSAGRDYEMPFFAGFDASQSELRRDAAKAARALGAPLIWEHAAVAPGRTISTATELGVPSVYVEASGGGLIRAHELGTLVLGLKRVVAAFGMMRGVAAPVRQALVLRGGDGDVDESLSTLVAGVCVSRVSVGAVVDEDEVICEIYVEGRIAERVTAPRPGTVMMLRRWPTVEPGQAIAMLGPTPVAAR